LPSPLSAAASAAVAIAASAAVVVTAAAETVFTECAEQGKDDNPPPIVAETVTHNLLPP